MVLLHDIGDLSLVLGHEQLLSFDFDPELVLDSIGGVSIQNKVPQHLLILMVFLLVELEEVLLAVDVVLELVDLVLQHVHLVLFQIHLVALDLLGNQKFCA